MIVVPFAPEHLARMRVQAAQVTEISMIRPDAIELLAKSNGWSALDGDHPLFCGGVIDMDDHHGLLWAYVSSEAGPWMLRITRGARRFLALKNLRRIETSVRADFAAGCRWAALMGFENEGLMRKYGFDGSDHFRYARIT